MENSDLNYTGKDDTDFLSSRILWILNTLYWNVLVYEKQTIIATMIGNFKKLCWVIPHWIDTK